jgi:hypothetical protein
MMPWSIKSFCPDTVRDKLAEAKVKARQRKALLVWRKEFMILRNLVQTNIGYFSFNWQFYGLRVKGETILVTAYASDSY